MLRRLSFRVSRKRTVHSLVAVLEAIISFLDLFFFWPARKSSGLTRSSILNGVWRLIACLGRLAYESPTPVTIHFARLVDCALPTLNLIEDLCETESLESDESPSPELLLLDFELESKSEELELDILNA